ncbi:sugar ABC transporter ATP-binding protein [Poseidonocella sp. HB161398]|uniref:sugar ABC transporter ATP-binding protein n=1 Tax=Poseidonocella sp. HB161398 TaxID=2320855 RepID=UPI001108CFA0|nr:sugar ABC transporter ATP-binding protein [Poseidonocella sp. HB161398]
MENPGGEPLLALDGIGHAFGRSQVLQNVSLSLAAGEVLGLAGENGAGKSTLMKIIGGYLAPAAGRVRWRGAPLPADQRGTEAAGITLVHQEFALIPDMSVAENIHLGREPRRFGMLDRRRMHRQAEEALALLDAALPPGALLRDLPVAAWQITELARAFAGEARLLLMDEPTAVLGRDGAAALFRRIRAFTEAGGAVIFTSHRLDEMREIGGRVAVLRDGQITLDQPVAATSEHRIASAMVGREMSDLFPPRAPRPAAPPVLEIAGLDVPRATGAPVRDAGFALRPGEVLGIAGLVGSGRTEMAEAIAGLRPATARQFVLDGRARPLPSAREAWRLGIAYLTEDRKARGLLLGADMAVNLALTTGALSGGARLDRAAERTAWEKARRRFDIRAGRAGTRAGQLSGGNQQKLLIAKTLAPAPRIVLFDEPTRGVDIGAKAQIYRIIADLAAAGTAVAVISSEMPELIGLAHRILVMDRGRVAGILEQPAGGQVTEEEILRLGLGLEPQKEHAA